MRLAIKLFTIFIVIPLNARCQAVDKLSGMVLNADMSVTLKLHAPNSKDVYVKGSFLDRQFKVKTKAGSFGKAQKAKMKKYDGEWIYTTKPLKSEFYTYCFVVDGQEQLDPSNPYTIRDVNDYFNYFIVGGGIADNYLIQNVPHGHVEKVWYPSTLKGMSKRRMTVYTPSEYKTNTTKTFPVLYLLHGSGGDENAWEEAGRAIQILYRVKKNKANRAIAGLSLGGLHTIFKSANNPEMFDYVGLFSAQTTNALNDNRITTLGGLATGVQSLASKIPFLNGTKFAEKVSVFARKFNDGRLEIYSKLDNKLKNQFANPPKLYYIAVGEDDFVKKLNDDFRAKLNAGNYKYIYNETDGGHSWENWRKCLIDFLPRLFK
jgi:enterochelin esterase family protein